MPLMVTRIRLPTWKRCGTGMGRGMQQMRPATIVLCILHAAFCCHWAFVRLATFSQPPWLRGMECAVRIQGYSKRNYIRHSGQALEGFLRYRARRGEAPGHIPKPTPTTSPNDLEISWTPAAGSMELWILKPLLDPFNSGAATP